MHFWAFSNSHRSNFSPHTANNVGSVYPEFFPSFNLYRVGGRDNCKKISKRIRCFMKEHRMTEKYEYCITSSFVHDCSVRRRCVSILSLKFSRELYNLCLLKRSPNSEKALKHWVYISIQRVCCTSLSTFLMWISLLIVSKFEGNNKKNRLVIGACAPQKMPQPPLRPK